MTLPPPSPRAVASDVPTPEPDPTPGHPPVPFPEPEPVPPIPDPHEPSPPVPEPEPSPPLPEPEPSPPLPEPEPQPAPPAPAPRPAPASTRGLGSNGDTVRLSTEQWRALEAVVMVATEPVPPGLLAQLLELPVVDVERACAALADHYEVEGRGYQLVRVAGGYRFQSHPDAAAYVERFVLEGQSARLSAAALETLAIIAYKQPISRGQIASIRGVDPDAVMRTLQHRGYIDDVGRDPGPGQAILWGTTPKFLEKVGLDSLGDLPPIAGFVPGADVVEALEHGLRVPDVDVDPGTETPPSGNGDGG